ncbi:MAG: hypothetical protein DMG70_21820, partial [Acidobacteria bacterium]
HDGANSTQDVEPGGHLHTGKTTIAKTKLEHERDQAYSRDYHHCGRTKKICATGEDDDNSQHANQQAREDDIPATFSAFAEELRK